MIGQAKPGGKNTLLIAGLLATAGLGLYLVIRRDLRRRGALRGFG
jgi:hypothetical protein